MSRSLWPKAALVAVCVAVHASALGGSFQYDDEHFIVFNPSVRSLSYLSRIFTDATTYSIIPAHQHYRPLTLLSHMMVAHFWGVRPAPFLVANLLIHCVNVLLIFGLCAKMRRRLSLTPPLGSFDSVAWTAGLLFAVHPLFSEAVNYVSARSESLSAMLMLAALYFYVGERRWWRVLVATGFAFAAPLAKATGAMTPLLALLLDLTAERSERSWRRFSLLSLGSIGGTILFDKMMPASTVEALVRYANLSSFQYFSSELPILWRYVRLFFIPVGQIAAHCSFVAHSFAEPKVLISFVAWIGTIGAAGYGLLRRRHVGLAILPLWFLICLGPSSSFFPLAETGPEYRPYLASVALCALTAEALCRPPFAFARGQLRSLLPVALVALTLASLTQIRNRAWSTEKSYWTEAVLKAPWCELAQVNYGIMLLRDGQRDQAEPHLRKGAEINPFNPYATMGLGELLLERSQPKEAIEQYDRALKAHPDWYLTQFSRGDAGLRGGESPASVLRYFSEAVKLAPSYAPAYDGLSRAHHAMQDLPSAIADERRAAQLSGDPHDRFALARLLIESKQSNEAEALLSELHRERPDDPDVVSALNALHARVTP